MFHNTELPNLYNLNNKYKGNNMEQMQSSFPGWIYLGLLITILCLCFCFTLSWKNKQNKRLLFLINVFLTQNIMWLERVKNYINWLWKNYTPTFMYFYTDCLLWFYPFFHWITQIHLYLAVKTSLWWDPDVFVDPICLKFRG